MKVAEFRPYTSWAEVRAFVCTHDCVYYRAPLDHWPTLVRARLTADGQSIMVIPPSADCDPFIADSGHLSRFLMRTTS